MDRSFYSSSLDPVWGASRFVSVSIQELDRVMQRIVAAGLLLNGCGWDSVSAPQVTDVLDELDCAVRSIRRLVFEADRDSWDFELLIEHVTHAANEACRLADAREHARVHLDEAARSLCRARIDVMEARSIEARRSVDCSHGEARRNHVDKDDHEQVTSA
jgi:hypothetical protein